MSERVIPKNVSVGSFPLTELRRRREEVARLYIGVFEEKPWNEKFIVMIDGERTRMGTPGEIEKLVRLISEGSVKGEDVKPFYTTEGVVANIERSIAVPGFVVAAAIDNSPTAGIEQGSIAEGRIIGISWGMPATQIPSNVKRSDVQGIVDSNGLPIESVFYFDETFVGIDFQGQKIGKELMKAKGLMASVTGYTYAVTRTMNEVQRRNYMSTFGEKNVTEVYSNPDDIQPDRKYYLIDLMKGLRTG